MYCPSFPQAPTTAAPAPPKTPKTSFTAAPSVTPELTQRAREAARVRGRKLGKGTRLMAVQLGYLLPTREQIMNGRAEAA